MENKNDDKNSPLANPASNVINACDDVYSDDPLLKPLLVTRATSIGDKKPNIAEKIGRAFTWAAMIPQGEFAGLLMVVFARKLKKYSLYAYIAVAALTAVPVAICATYGKVEIVWDFGQSEWRKLGNKTWQQFFVDMSPHTWIWNESIDSTLHPILNHLFGIIEKLFTFNAALNFGMLARVANDAKIGAGEFAQEIGVQPFKVIGKYIFPNPGWQAGFGIPSFVSNLMSFGSAHRYSIHCIHQSLTDFIDIFRSGNCDDDPDNTKKFMAVFAYFVDAVNNGDTATAQSLLKLITMQEQQNELTIFDNIVNYYKNTSELKAFLPKPKSRCEKFTTWLSGTVAAGLTGWGLLNFSQMWQIIFSTLPQSIQPPKLVLEIMSWTLFVSMALMATTVYPQVKSYAARAFGRKEPSIRFCSRGKEWFNFIKAQFICIVGSTPNVFQAILAKLSIPATVAACFASWCLEVRAVQNRYETLERSKAMKNDKLCLVNGCGLMLFRALQQLDNVEADRIAQQLQTEFNNPSYGSVDTSSYNSVDTLCLNI